LFGGEIGPNLQANKHDSGSVELCAVVARRENSVE
jgi:hypothetical protein